MQWSNMAASGAADESSNLSRATTTFAWSHGCVAQRLYRLSDRLYTG